MNSIDQDKLGYKGVYKYVHSFPDVKDGKCGNETPVVVIARSPDSFFEAAKRVIDEVRESETKVEMNTVGSS